MNLEYLEKCANRHHLGTLAIVEKLLRTNSNPDEACPYLAKKGSVIHFYVPAISNQEPNYDYINPFIMNGAFSLELKMKYLHALETNKKMDAGHRLLDIFTKLTNKSKECIRSNFKEIVKHSKYSKDVTKYFNENTKIQFSWDLHKLLSNADLAFERWRYIYEEKESTWFAGYSEIQKAITKRIEEVKC